MLFFNYVLFLIVITLGDVRFLSDKCYATSASSAVAPRADIEFDKLEVRPLSRLSEVDQHQFIEFFVSTLDKAYEPFTLEQLGKTSYKTKKDWLRETAEGEIKDALKNKEKQFGYLLFYQSTDLVGYLALQVEGEGKSVYLAQGCIEPRFWGQGGVAYVMERIVPQYAPNAERYNLLVRVLNGRAIHAYEKLGFIKDTDDTLAEKHDYSNEHYIGMHKILETSLEG